MMDKFTYEVVESSSRVYPVGLRFTLCKKLHDNRTKDKVVALEDVELKPFKLRLIR